jgi:hypothetical protein
LSIAVAVYTGVHVAALLKGKLFAQAFFTAVAGGAASGAISSGTIEGAAWGAFSAGVFFGIGQWIHGADSLWNSVEGVRTSLNATGIAVKTVSHGIAGGTISRLQGGRFGHGFAAAAGSAAVAPFTDSAKVVEGAIVTSLVGGTLSKATGGKFANGAVTAAMSYAFNQMASGGPEIKGKDYEATSGGVQPTIDLSVSYNSPGDALEALDVAIASEAKKPGNSPSVEYGGITVALTDSSGVTRYYNSNIVTSNSARGIIWDNQHLDSINSGSPIVALHHSHPLSVHGAVPKVFSGGDMKQWRQIKHAMKSSAFQGIYMRDKHGVRKYDGGEHIGGKRCAKGIASC